MVRPSKTASDGGGKSSSARNAARDTSDKSAGKRQPNNPALRPKSEISGGNPIHRRLRFHEKKLLRNHDFMQYPQDLWHEPYCVQKYHLQDREDYRRYLRLVGLIRGLMTQLRYLPAESKIRIQITQQLTKKVYDMGLIDELRGLQEIDKLGVEAFCKRRLPSILVKLKMAPNCKIASDFVEHGHVRAGVAQIKDPAFLVPRDMEDLVTWTKTSKIRKSVATFNGMKDDFADV